MKRFKFPPFKSKSERLGFLVCMTTNILLLLWATISANYLDQTPQQWTPWTFNLSLIVFGLVGDPGFGSGCLRALGYLFLAPFVLGIVFFAGCIGIGMVGGALMLLADAVNTMFFLIGQELQGISPAGIGAIVVSIISIMSAISFVHHSYRQWKEDQN